MIKKRKRTLLIIALLVGVFVSFWFVGNSNRPESAGVVKNNSIKKIREFVSLNDISAAKREDANITNSIISDYTKDILKLNKKGSGLSSKIALPSGSTLNKIIQDRFTEGVPIKLFKTGDLRVSDNTSKKSVIEYLKNIEDIYRGGLSSKQKMGFLSSIADYINNGKTESLQSYLSMVSNRIDKLLSTSAPKDWLDFHLKLINSWQKRLTLGTAILENEKDPIKAVVAVQEISNSIDEENLLLLDLQEKLKNI